MNPYHLVIVYYRSDFAELLAGALLPLLVWGAVRVGRGEWHRVPMFAAGICGDVAFECAGGCDCDIFAGAVAVVQCVHVESFQPILLAVLRWPRGFGLAAFYILPAAREQRWVQITQVLADNLDPRRNFLFTHANDPDFAAFNWKVSYVAVAVIVVTLIAAVMLVMRRHEFRVAIWTLTPLGLASVLLMLPFTNFVWHVLPELRFVQFPWRWLEVLALVFAFFVAAALGDARRTWISWAAGAALAVALFVGARAMVRTAWWDSGDVPAMAASITSGAGYRGTDEYDPLGCDRYELPAIRIRTSASRESRPRPRSNVELVDPEKGDIVAAPAANVEIEKWSAEQREFSAREATPVTLAVKLLNFPAWDVRMDGGAIQPGYSHDNGQMLVPVPAGDHHVSIRFRRTRDRSAGGVISIAFALVLLGFAVQKKTQSP